MDTKNAKILLVEDDTKVCAFINKGLTEEGFEVSIALNGKEGYQMASSNKFDLLILDIMLPEMNGMEICKAVREENRKRVGFHSEPSSFQYFGFWLRRIS